MTFIPSTGGGTTFPRGLPHQDSIIFYVDASDSSSYTSGTTATDVAGNGTNGTLESTTTVTNGAFQITGAGLGVSFDKNATLNNLFTGGGTVMTFVQVDSEGGGNEGRLVSTEDASETVGWGFYTLFGTSGDYDLIVFQRNASGSNGSWQTQHGIPRGDSIATGGGFGYASVAISYDDALLGNDPDIYINGIIDNNQVDTNPTGTVGDDTGEQIIIGNLAGGAKNMDGQSQITIAWSRKLLAEEILQVHNLFAPRVTREGSGPGTVGFQPSSGVGQGPNVLRNTGVQPPSISDTSASCVNLQSQANTTTQGILGNCNDSAILSGRNNAMTTVNDSVICGGSDQVMTGGSSFIGGGGSNTMTGGTSGIASGSSHSCGGSNNFIGGGFQNTISAGFYSSVSGGRGNSTADDYCFVGGGRANTIGIASEYTSILGGQNHDIAASGFGASYSWIDGGFDCEINDAAAFMWFGNAAGRKSNCNHDGASIWSDSTDQVESTDRDNQHKRVYVGGFTERTTVGFGGGTADPGEALERFTGHATTTDATPNITVLGTLDTDLHTMVFDVFIHSSRDTATHFIIDKFVVTAYRVAGTVTVNSESIMTVIDPGTDSGSFTFAFAASGDDIRLTITGPVENWQHSFHYTRQEGGLTA